MRRLACPRLMCVVELSEERRRHIAERHPDLLPTHEQLVRQTVLDPDMIRWTPRRPELRKLSRCYPVDLDGRHVVVVLIDHRAESGRIWIVTAYGTRRLNEECIEWRRS
jgi:hypothetical protein